MLGAGLPLDRSLSLLANLIEGKEFSKVMRTLLEAVRAGKSLACIDGRTSTSFSTYLRKHDSRRRGRGYFGKRSALPHRIFGEHHGAQGGHQVGIGLPDDPGDGGRTLVDRMFLFVIPKFAALFHDNRQAIPWITKVVIDFSQMLSQYGWLILLVVAVVAAGAIFYVRSPEGRSEWDRLLLEGMAYRRPGAKV